ncbi:MAG: hypothetical protein IPO08_22660 [Xanthomonadales bacterium]|nr:hypothetical protein [Xanthomonadales bacterium]
MAKAKMSVDGRTLLLLADVERRRKELESPVAVRPWKTSGSFSYSEPAGLPGPNQMLRVNLQNVLQVAALVNIGALLLARQQAFDRLAVRWATELTGKDASWQGYPIDDWLYDLETRVMELTRADKLSNLVNLQQQLDGLLSPDQQKLILLEKLATSVADLK